MKHLKFILIASIGLLFVVSCDDQAQQFISDQSTVSDSKVESLKVYDRDEIASTIESLSLETSNLRAPKWWKKVKKWFKDHAGTHLFDNCNGNGNCGPCAGICITLGFISGTNNDSDVISALDYQNGYRVYSFSIIENTVTREEKVLVELKHNEDFITDDNLYIAESSSLSEEMVISLGKSNIVIAPGVYPIVYDENTLNGQTVLDAVIE